ncbi:MAG: cyclopropane-fatty-acyl-phospholipid synthase [Actinomycetota bacterium]|jgi:cyclopropane-fatty-acyl-phospholipid synthase|nr:cyclopropane-fatty-acyl-phospholipid synthase [Actinomycetota bacterium]MDQ1666392.1 cyclopropane-fatty-acyl-phospholipid synthase [Actinomycetota bacterium]MDQ1669135.1 cyclopropane-fatty-acyl-phospholipid synthase [Actinomycetota bacterium]
MSLRLETPRSSRRATVTLGEIFTSLFGPDAPVRFSAYDGSTAGQRDAAIGIRLATPRAASYLATAPGSLGLARAYIQGDLEVDGVPPGDPYDVLRLIDDELNMRRPAPGEAMRWLQGLGLRTLLPPEPPPQEVRPFAKMGLKHGRGRDANAISYHYDVSNRFYEMVLGPSMTYTCACYPTDSATLEQAQEHKYDLVARKLGLQPGMRLLDVGCGWGGMVRHAARNYGVQVLGVTLSREQATWGQARLKAEGLDDLAEVRHLDYRDVREGDFDAVSSIGLIEHIGVKQYGAYFSFLRSRLRPGGRLLNHGITRPDNKHAGLPRRGFIGRYVFPDGELTGSGDIVSAMEDAGLEVQHHENLRVHYARTLQGWCDNLVENWDECVAEAGLATAKVWGLYMAGSRLAFERNGIQLHQVLATRTAENGESSYPLRHDFGV